MKRIIFVVFLLCFVTLELFIFSYGKPFFINQGVSSKINSGLLRNSLWIGVMTLAIILFMVMLWKRKILRFFVVLLASIFLANIVLSLFLIINYDSGLSIGVADSILNTNSHEARGMLGFYAIYLFIFVFLLICFLWCIQYFSKEKVNRIIIGFLFISSIVLLGRYLDYSLSSKYKKFITPPFANTLEKTPFFNGHYFLRSIYNNKEIQKIQSTPMHYQIRVRNTDIENYIVVLGESARRNNLSLYGYNRETTPYLDSQKNNMLIYTRAVAPAAITTLAIPLVLSPVPLEEYAINKFSDNIIKLAKVAGYETYWYSVQGKTGEHDSTISAIALGADHKQWFSGYDEILLKPLHQALQSPRKKIIFLHLNGSHMPACQYFPEDRAYFHDSDVNKMDNCYDNSIRYTDYVLENIIKEISKSKSILFYLSDHGQERNENKAAVYYHGGDRLSKEAFDVPFLVWYSPLLLPTVRKTGVIKDQVSTSILYDLLKESLGIQDIHTHQNIINRNQPTKVLNNALQVLDYDDFPEHQ